MAGLAPHKVTLPTQGRLAVQRFSPFFHRQRLTALIEPVRRLMACVRMNVSEVWIRLSVSSSNSDAIEYRFASDRWELRGLA